MATTRIQAENLERGDQFPLDTQPTYLAGHTTLERWRHLHNLVRVRATSGLVFEFPLGFWVTVHRKNGHTA